MLYFFDNRCYTIINKICKEGSILSFCKTTSFELNGDNTEVLTGELNKTASFSLPDGFVYDPEYLYLKVRAVSGGEYWGCNKNYDYFPWEELKAQANTFLSAHVFKNHENKKIEDAIGDILSVIVNDEMKCVELIIRISKSVAPSITKGFEKGFMTDVSMGCRVKYSVCSICGNKAKTKVDFCDHIKYERGRIYDDGRQVYEINVEPKFHDISAVLNGAEKSAKVLDLKLETSDNVKIDRPITSIKVACENQNALEKVASETPIKRFTSPFYSPDIEMEHFIDKEAHLNKISEISKRLDGKVISSSISEYRDDLEKRLGNIVPQLKMLYEDFLDERSCVDIGRKLQRIADENHLTENAVFGKFLECADYCSIEFSPLEISLIFKSLIGKKVSEQNPAPEIPQNLDSAYSENIPSGVTCTKVLRAIPRMQTSLPALSNSSNPGTAAKIIIMKRISGTPKDDGVDTVRNISPILDILRPLMESRSMQAQFLGPRLTKMASEKRKPNFARASKHFAPILKLNNPIFKTASDIEDFVTGYAWAAYEKEREVRAMSNNFDSNAEKIACLMDDECLSKQASAFTKSLTIGVPAAYAYSAWQRARMRNGKKVSSINRAIAENPDGTAMTQFLAVNGAAKFLNKNKTGQAIKSGATGIGRAVKSGITNNKIVKGITNKIPKVAFEKNIIENSSLVLNNSDIDDIMIKEGYTIDDVKAIKASIVFNELKKDDLAGDVLKKASLNEEDVKNYLHSAKDFVKINLEKNAQLISDMSCGKLGDGDMLDIGMLSKLYDIKKTFFKKPKGE